MTSLTVRKIFIILALVCFRNASSFVATPRGQKTAMFRLEDKKNGDDLNPFTKASWYAVEAFGQVFGQALKSKDDETIQMDRAPSSLEETKDRIERDITERSYFLSGQVDELIYSEDCVFADPFVSFEGRDRFVSNLANLGSFITNYSAKLLSLDSSSPTEVTTKLMVKLELNLPWKPVLAWPWGVRYVVDPSTFLITTHEESWDIEPLEGVLQIFRKPTTSVK
mmetsp:Transcript_19960/g.30000  ORF Transcript_19960/g.30000 Transcript_19960/m.30000 type:complete len:224 (+) Transcript_19960:33-704(+)